MKRAEISSPKASIAIRSYDKIPEPPQDGLVLKTAFCGICHSDVHMADDEFSIGGDEKLKFSDFPGVTFPAVLGHEIGGTVHSIGANGADDILKVGDRVIVYPWTGCNNCPFCKVGEGSLCTTSLPIGCGIDGGYSEYVSVPRRDFVLKIPDELPMDIACMLPCSGLTGYNAITKVKPTIDNFVKLKGTATLLIVGAGGLGLWCLQTAKACLPKEVKIIIADISESKLENARAQGADDSVLWDSSLAPLDIVNLTKSKGIDGEINAVIDFVNSSDTAQKAHGCLTKGGSMALVGLFGGAMTFPLPVFALSVHQFSGVYVGSLQQLKELVELVARAKLNPPKLSYVKLEDAPEVLKKLRKGEIDGRALIKY